MLFLEFLAMAVVSHGPAGGIQGPQADLPRIRVREAVGAPVGTEYAWVAIGAFTPLQEGAVARMRGRLKKLDIGSEAATAGFDVVASKDGGAVLVPNTTRVRRYADDLRRMGRFVAQRGLLAKNPDGSPRFAAIGDFPEDLRDSVLRDVSYAGNAQLDMAQKVTAEAGLDLTLTGVDGRKVRLPMALGKRGNVGSTAGYESQAAAYRPLSDADAKALDKGGYATDRSRLTNPSYFTFPSVKIQAWGGALVDRRNAASAMRVVTAEISRRVDEAEKILADAYSELARTYSRSDPETDALLKAEGKSTDALPPGIANQLDQCANNARLYGFGSPDEFRAFLRSATVSDVSMGLGLMTAVRGNGPNGLKIFGHEY